MFCMKSSHPAALNYVCTHAHDYFTDIMQLSMYYLVSLVENCGILLAQSFTACIPSDD